MPFLAGSRGDNQLKPGLHQRPAPTGAGRWQGTLRGGGAGAGKAPG